MFSTFIQASDSLTSNLIAAAITIPTPNYSLALPEILLLGMICFILLFDLLLNDKTRVISYALAQATLIGLIYYTVSNFSGTAKQLTFNGSFVRDAMGDLVKISIYVTGILVFLYSKDYLKKNNLFKGEYFVIGLIGILGMMIMVSAYSFITLYLGLEVLALSLYAMVAFNRDSVLGAEAAIKYFILGAIASGMLLYGMSMVFGVTGSLGLTEIAAFASKNNSNLILGFGLVFIVIGIAFKLGAVPFHMWVPDVYQGAPTCVTLYLGSIPKLAAFALMMRLLVDGLQPLMKHWQEMLIIMAVLSMAIGNLVAIAQTNIKRMLAYSAISHVGFLLLGILSGTAAGYSAALFYTITYALMATAAFGAILLFSRAGFDADKLEDYKGLNERSPWFAFVILVIMFSLAGVPPTVGFFAKLLVLQAVVKVGLTWIAIVAVAFAIVGVFYYIRVVKLMYFDKTETAMQVTAGWDTRTMMSVNALAILGLGLYPYAIITFCNAVLLPA